MNLKEKGITLIALVITIIVLLILAGISISMLTGENGILKQATNASIQTDIESTKEKITLELLSKINEDNSLFTVVDIEKAVTTVVGTNTLDTVEMTAVTKQGNIMDLSDLFENADIESYVITTNLTGVWANDGNATSAKETGKTTLTYTTTNAWRMPSDVTVTGADYTWDSDSGNLVLTNVTDDVSVTITADEYYGAEVTNYIVGDSTLAGVLEDETDFTWKIFYEDNDYTYLIASDYIPSEAAPAGAKNTAITANSTYRLSFNDVYQDYTGSANITDIKLQALNSNYFDYIKSNSATTWSNIRAIAYMMDQSIWDIYKDEDKNAEYVIAGPTVELLFKSYNEKYGTNYQTRVQNYGYQISKDGSSYSTSYSEMLNTSDDIYVISSTSKTNAMFLASTSSVDVACVVDVYYNGMVASYSYNGGDQGLRPLVFLKSDVQLKLQSDGTYEIQ